MKSASTRLLAAATVACAGTFCTPAAFAQGTFNAAAAGDECNPTGSATNTYASVTCTAIGSVGVSLQAWGFTGNALSASPQIGFQRGTLGDFNSSGFGAYTGNLETSATGQHGFDNVTSGCGTTAAPTATGVTLATGCGGSIEALFLDFGAAKVNLTNIGIGWSGADADLSVWAWTGAGAANMSNTQASGSTTTLGTTAATLSGWTLVSNHAFAGNTITSQTANTNGTLYSSYFLVTTYFGAQVVGSLTAGNDSFKLNSFTAGLCTGTLSGATCTPGRVSEPGSVALAGLALVGLFASRRKVRALF